MMLQARLLVGAACLLSTSSAIGWSGSFKSPLAATETHDPEVKAEKPSGNGYEKMTVGIKFRKSADAKQAAVKKEESEDKSDDKGNAESKDKDAKETSDKKEKDKDEQTKGEAGGEEKPEHSGVLMAITMFLTIALLSMVVALTSASNQVISSNAWFVVDQVILIFIAVMNYQAFGDLMHHYISSPEGKIATAAVQAFALFLIALFLSWKMKSNPVALAIFCGGGAHFVAFASCHLTEVVEDKYSGDDHLWRKLIVFAGFGAVFVAFSAGVYFLKKKARMENDDWNDKITDTENDFIAMAMAVVFTTFIFHLIIGKDHDIEVEPDEAVRIERTKEVMVLAYAVVMIPLAVILNKWLTSRRDSASMLMQRVVMFFGGFCAMCSCWAFLFLGQMHFYSNFCKSRPLFCRVIFAVITNVVCAIAILVLAKLTQSRGPRALNKDVTVALTAFSLAAAWSWEQTFDAAMDSMNDHFGRTNPHFKVILSLTLVCIMLPTYASYIKPVVIQKTECLEG